MSPRSPILHLDRPHKVVAASVTPIEGVILVGCLVLLAALIGWLGYKAMHVLTDKFSARKKADAGICKGEQAGLFVGRQGKGLILGLEHGLMGGDETTGLLSNFPGAQKFAPGPSGDYGLINKASRNFKESYKSVRPGGQRYDGGMDLRTDRRESEASVALHREDCPGEWCCESQSTRRSG
jgi:hypothetical protein